MTRRIGWVAYYTLRLGLLLGGVAAVWGAHEVAAGSAAHAADRPPLTATVETLTHTLGAVLGLPASGAVGVESTPAAAPASAPTISRPRNWSGGSASSGDPLSWNTATLPSIPAS